MRSEKYRRISFPAESPCGASAKSSASWNAAALIDPEFSQIDRYIA